MVPASVDSFLRPTPLVRLPCGSTSTRRTRRSASAREAARLMVVVVLPTPPFWLATARIRLIWSITRIHGCVGQSWGPREDTELQGLGQLVAAVPRGTAS